MSEELRDSRDNRQQEGPLSDYGRERSATERRLPGPLLAQLPDLHRWPEPHEHRLVDAEHRPGLADLQPDPQFDRRRRDDGAPVRADAAARTARRGAGRPAAEA